MAALPGVGGRFTWPLGPPSFPRHVAAWLPAKTNTDQNRAAPDQPGRRWTPAAWTWPAGATGHAHRGRALARWSAPGSISPCDARQPGSGPSKTASLAGARVDRAASRATRPEASDQRPKRPASRVPRARRVSTHLKKTSASGSHA